MKTNISPTGKSPRFEVVVGNIGSVELTDNYGAARKVYGEYRKQSLEGYGRASGEDVALLDDGEPRLEHLGDSVETFEVELTDTFGGEANYSWVRRETITVPKGASQALVMRRAKRSMDMQGVKGSTEAFGDEYHFKPFGVCVVMFVTSNDQ